MNEESLRREADGVYGWSNGPGDRYARHTHPFTKILYCVSGSIDFATDAGAIKLAAGDRMVPSRGDRPFRGRRTCGLLVHRGKGADASARRR